MMAELGNISIGEIGKEIGKRWSSLDKDMKEKYKNVYMKAMAMYQVEMKNYLPSQQFLEKKADIARRQQTEQAVFFPAGLRVIPAGNLQKTTGNIE